MSRPWTNTAQPNIANGKRLLGAEYSVSYNKMLGQLTDAGNTTTLARYLDLLASAGLLAGLPNHSNQPHRRRGSSPKLNVLNTALMTAGSGYAFDEARADRTFWGRVVESAVGAHLYNTEASDIGLNTDKNPRGRLRPAAGSQGGGHRGQERPAASEHLRHGRVRETGPLPRRGSGRHPPQRVPERACGALVRGSMTIIVQRTCTEVLSKTETQRREPITGPLELFRSAPAYVLLGDPGSGKSTTFKTEADLLGAEAISMSARDFLASDVHSHPEWRGKTLFIDALDEMRVGSGDRREALDSIRRSLDALGRPPFRISCREADWLGDNDRDRLPMVSPNASVKVLRLNPLTGGDVVQILEAHPAVGDAQRFVSEARERGVDTLLSNPLTLNMLAAAVGGNGIWPQSRLETFEMACFQMVKERNPEHSRVDPPPYAERLLDAAGRLCAYQLFSGAAGWSPVYDDTDTDFISLNVLEPSSLAVADHALSSRLFTGLDVNDGRVAPVHRQIAEFLSARYLARLIEDGLPAGRVVQLITAGDGMVVTVFRGLSAWLAALCPTARPDLISRDPAGVGLYGDLHGFSVNDKRALLASLNREVAYYGINVAAFAPLAAPDMASVIRDILNDPRRDTDHQAATDLLLRVLRHGQPLVELAPVLLEVIYDDTRWPRVTKAALDAFIHTTAESADGITRLRRILFDTGNGTIADQDNELLASLLAALYPREIPLQKWLTLVTKHRQSIPENTDHAAPPPQQFKTAPPRTLTQEHRTGPRSSHRACLTTRHCLNRIGSASPLPQPVLRCKRRSQLPRYRSPVRPHVLHSLPHGYGEGDLYAIADRDKPIDAGCARNNQDNDGPAPRPQPGVPSARIAP